MLNIEGVMCGAVSHFVKESNLDTIRDEERTIVSFF
jgi:hypothetical protein